MYNVIFTLSTAENELIYYRDDDQNVGTREQHFFLIDDIIN
jgi:hypothetical protein